jgi:Tol biopolymer transport system component
MALQPGDKLGPYEILSPLGAGGMGEVYKARDTRLDRTVAVKVLPRYIADRDDLRARFEREARAVASLNHPHICVLHDIGKQDGIDFMVLEHLEGETLAARAAKGPLGLDQVLKCATQIADALDRAHRSGFSHRDVKPANIMLTRDGVKVLDFGLAKTAPKAVGPDDVTRLPDALTGEGTILGTPQYMAPEQYEGKEADARSDIFAFGCVVYEMLTGKRCFDGKTKASLIAAVLGGEPVPMSTLIPVTPPALERLVKRCIEKDPEDRYQSMRDVVLDLRSIGAVQEGGRADRKFAPLGWPVAVAALAMLAAGAVSFVHFREKPPARQAARFRLDLPEGVTLAGSAGPVFSPDGSKIMVAGLSGRSSQLWIRSLDSPTLRPLPGTEGATSVPVFAPDSRAIVFMSGPSLRRLDLAGGASQTLCALQGQDAGPVAWSREGGILVQDSIVIKRVSASGGAPAPVTAVAAGETSHIFANFLPDGRHFLYYVYTQGSPNGGVNTGATNVGSIDDLKFRKRILEGTGPAKYASPGWLLFSRDGVLLAQPFDADKLELSGEPAPVAEQVAGGINVPGYAYSVSETGSLAWRPGTDVSSMELAWFDRTGKKLGTIGEPGEIANPVLSPDGKRVLITIRDPGTKTRDVWMLDLDRGSRSRLTFDPAEDYNPIWSPDGAWVIFSSNRKGHKDIYRKRADGVGAEEELLVSDVDKSVDSISPDGKYLSYNVEIPGKPISTWSLPLMGDRKPTAIAGRAYANFSQFSPNGRWIAYMSLESGRLQVYVQNAPGSGMPAGKWQVSNAGGTMPQWRRDGKELFYVGSGRQLMAVPVRSDGTSFESGTPAPLFTARLGVSRRNHFTVSADGQRFLFAWPRDSGSTGEVHVLLDWAARLKKN